MPDELKNVPLTFRISIRVFSSKKNDVSARISARERPRSVIKVR